MNMNNIINILFTGLGVTIIEILYKLYKDKKDRKKVNVVIENIDNQNSKLILDGDLKNYKMSKNRNKISHVKLNNYFEWVKKKHPNSDINDWIGLFFAGYALLIVPGVIMTVFWIYLKKKWMNEYCIYAIEEALRVNDIVTASDYSFQITKTGIPIEHYATVIYSTIIACQKYDDKIRASQLLIRLKKI